MNFASHEWPAWKSNSGFPCTHYCFGLRNWQGGMPVLKGCYSIFMAREAEAPDTPCGCTNCYRLFSFADIAEFWDDGETPVCPCCGSDNVLISTPEMIVDAHCLFAMRKTYY
jgi:hypothetical protein